MKSLRVLCALGCLFLSLVPAVRAQHIYIDTDGDGISSPSDHLNALGETIVAVYLDTSHDRDGGFRPCGANSKRPGVPEGTLDLYSYDLILKVESRSGSVRWGEFTDAIGFTRDRGDRSSPTELLVTRRGTDALSPGRYMLGKISITTNTGSPVLQIGTDSKLDPAAFTGFGTHCSHSMYTGTYVMGIDWLDTGSTAASAEGAPSSLGLSIAFPSRDIPSPGSVFMLSLPAPDRVRLAIYDVGGRLVRTIVDTPSMAAGRRTLAWDGRNTSGRRAASGIYFVRFDAGNSTLTRKFALVK